MAYAKLVFPSTATVGQKLKEIAKICSGATTSTADLEFATQASSIVISTEPAAWTLADAASALEASGTATRTSYRLSAPCVDTSKTKYCEIGAWSLWTCNNQANNANTRPSATGQSGFLWAPIGTGTSGTALSNPVWYPANLQDVNGSSAFTYASINLGSTSTTFYVSVTARKLIIFGLTNPQTVGHRVMVMNLEFPETPHTVLWNNLPFINIHGSILTNNNAGNLSVNYLGDTTGTTNAILYKAAWLTDWYSTADATRARRRADTLTLPNIYSTVIPSMTINANGTAAYPLVPLMDVRTAVGEQVHNYSSLTNTYWTYRSSTYATDDDEITVGSDTYVVLNLGDSTANYRALALKKA
jgi:hypothetical protein